MTVLLRDSTAGQEVMLGPIRDLTDASFETALTPANTDIQIWKAGSSTLVNKNSGGATHVASGCYITTLDATDTGTLGSGIIYVPIADTFMTPIPFCVLPTDVYDSIILGSDSLTVDLNADQSGVTVGECDVVNALSDAAADDVLDQVCEGAVTVRAHLTCIASALFGKTSGGGTTTRVFRNVGDTKDRITVTMDASGNRTAVVTDGT